MRCEAFHERVNELLDRRADLMSDAELSRHAAQCADCAAMRNLSAQWVAAMDVRRPADLDAEEVGYRTRWTMFAAAATVIFALVSQSQFFSKHTSEADDTAFSSDVAYEELLSEQESESLAFVHQPIIGLGLLASTDWDSSIALDIPFGEEQSVLIEQRWKAVADGVQPVRESVNSTFWRVTRSVSKAVNGELS